jgi:hypothetical protein
MSCILILNTCLLVATPAVDPDVRQAIEFYDALEFERVIPLLQRALARPELSDADRIEALACLARTEAVYRHRQRAVRAFVKLLRLAPDYGLSTYESPLIQRAFEQAQQRLGVFSEESGMATDTPTDIEPPAVDDVLAAGESDLEEPPALEWTSIPIPVPEESPYELPLTTETEPVPPKEAQGTSFWLIFGIVSGVVIAGAVAAAVIQPWRSSDPPAGTLGTLELP